MSLEAHYLALDLIKDRKVNVMGCSLHLDEQGIWGTNAYGVDYAFWKANEGLEAIKSIIERKGNVGPLPAGA